MKDTSDNGKIKKTCAHLYAGHLELRVGRVGLEPTRCHHRRILSPLRLPVPPPPHLLFILYPNISPRQAFLIQDFRNFL